MAKEEISKNTKRKLLDSAAELFTEHGYACTSVADICAGAGANIAAVNYHFRSKDALYRSVLQYTFDQAERLYPMEEDENMAVEDRLYGFVLSLLKRILSTATKGNFYKLVAKEMAEPTEASGDLISKIIFKKREQIKEIITELYAKPMDDELLLKMTHSIVSQCLFLGLHQKGRMHHLKRSPLQFSDAESFARHISRFSLAGITCYQK